MQRRTWAVALAACATGLGSCADLGRVASLTPPPVNPESPVAAQVQAAVNRSYPYPSFRDVPAKPRDLPTPGQVKAEVVGLVQTRRAQERWVAANPPLSGDGQAWVAQAQGQLPASVHIALPPDQAARSAADAAQLRAMAAAPPPMNGSSASIVSPTPPAYLPAPAHEPALPPVASKRGKKFKPPAPPASAPHKPPA